MNKRIILASALAIASVAAPAFAAKTTPALVKAKIAQTQKIKCSKVENKVSAKTNASRVVSLKKAK